MRKFAFSLTGNLADADDLLQSTVERALTRGAPVDDGEALLKWMFTVCRNLWIDEVRARRVRGADDPDPPEGDAQSHDGEAELLGTLAITELQAALSRLSADQRAVLELVGVEGYSYREAADVLEVPIGTVMSRLARARAALADALAAGNRSASWMPARQKNSSAASPPTLTSRSVTRRCGAPTMPSRARSKA